MKRIIAASVVGAVLFGSSFAFAAEKSAQDATGVVPAKTAAVAPLKKAEPVAPHGSKAVKDGDKATQAVKPAKPAEGAAAKDAKETSSLSKSPAVVKDAKPEADARASKPEAEKAPGDKAVKASPASTEAAPGKPVTDGTKPVSAAGSQAVRSSSGPKAN